MRLSKFLSISGVASRRKTEELIKSGRIKVNNEIVLEPFFNIEPEKDTVTIDDTKVKSIKKLIYIALYKPIKYISDLKDDKGRKLARELIDIEGKLFPVGRLDYNSEGLILFTNDGDFANIIMHPKYGIEKEYFVKVKDALDNEDILRLKKGIKIDNDFCKVEKITFLKSAQKNNWYVFIVKQGKNRMIRKMCLAIKHPVLKLVRVRIGNITLGNLEPGQYRFLTEKEIKYIKSKSQNI